MISAKWHRFAAYCILVHMVPISASLHQSSSRRCSCILVACGTFFSVVICNKASNLVNLFVHEDEAVNCSPSPLLCTTLSTHLHLVACTLCCYAETWLPTNLFDDLVCNKAVNCSPSLLLCTTLSTHLHLVQLVPCVENL